MGYCYQLAAGGRGQIYIPFAKGEAAWMQSPAIYSLLRSAC